MSEKREEEGEAGEKWGRKRGQRKKQSEKEKWSGRERHGKLQGRSSD